MKRELLEYSYANKLSHIPSALSMLEYVDKLFTDKLVTPDDFIILGKPFGAQAYYIVWRKLGYLTDIEKLSVGVKHDEIDFVDYSEETMGNALGVAAGIAMTTDKLVWVNLSDAALQMGNTLEAIQFIGHHKLKNVLVTIDYNDSQVLGNISDILPVEPVLNFFRENSWHVNTDIEEFKIGNLPKVFVMKTKKGSGIPSMEKDIKKWHYKKIETLEELQSLVAELPGT
jgi:transketolase